MIRPARQTFSTSAHREPMEKISLSETFLVGCDYALLVLGEELPDPMNPVAQAQLVGARRVLDILKTIGDPTQKPQERKARGLNYES